MALRICPETLEKTIRVDRIVRRYAVEEPYKNATAITGDLRSRNIAIISGSNVSSRLRDVGLCGRVDDKKNFISKKESATLFTFIKEHQGKNGHLKTGKSTIIR